MKVGDLVNFVLPRKKKAVVLLVSVRTIGCTPSAKRVWGIIEGGEIYEVAERWLRERVDESR